MTVTIRIIINMSDYRDVFVMFLGLNSDLVSTYYYYATNTNVVKGSITFITDITKT